MILATVARRAQPLFCRARAAPTRHGRVVVDRRGLVNVLPSAVDESKLTRDLRMLIEKLGPMTVADYMGHALQHPKHGYYTTQDEVIGPSGDFTTAPEISQLFGEAVCVWCMSVWAEMGAPPNVRLVEMGPGKGTLMADLLRTAKSFPAFRSALEKGGVHLVETSPRLREKQCELLLKTQGGARLDPPPSQAAASSVESGSAPSSSSLLSAELRDGLRVEWHGSLHDVPDDGPLLFIGQELLDALPVHQFECTAKGWRERLVELAKPGDAVPFRFVLASGDTPASRAYLRSAPDGSVSGGGGRPKKLEELKALLDFNAEPWRKAEVQAAQQAQEAREEAREGEEASPLGEPNGSAAGSSEGDLAGGSMVGSAALWGGAAVGDELEVCPAACALVQDVAARLARWRGGALLVDYGEDFALPNSLRAFHNHQEAHVLHRPGEFDLTADVDFASIRRAVAHLEGVVCAGPVEQGQWLASMGCPERLLKLIERDECSDEEAERMVEAYERLVAPDQMGKRYKVLALVDAKQSGPVPGGFDAP